MDIDGKLVGPWVDELRRAIGTPRSGETLCLNLQRLTFADADGLRLLRDVTRDGVFLVGTLPLIEGLLALRTQTGGAEGGESDQQERMRMRGPKNGAGS